METLEEIFHPNGFIEKSAVWPVGGRPVRRIIFACVPTNCDDAAARSQSNLGFDIRSIVINVNSKSNLIWKVDTNFQFVSLFSFVILCDQYVLTHVFYI